MTYYNNNNSNNSNNNSANAWTGPAAGGPNAWEAPRRPSHAAVSAAIVTPAPGFDGHQARAGAPAAGAKEEGEAFYYQFKNIDRVLETWRKSNKNGSEPRAPLPQRFQPPVDFTPMQAPFNGPPPPAFFSPVPPPPPPPPQGPPARFGGARQNEPDQALQAKRRMAAQRERDLRNYHQDQQFNKHLSGAKSDRSMSPNTAMSENERRELIARQHRALYGEDSSLYNGESPVPRTSHGAPDSRDGPEVTGTNEQQRNPRSRAVSNASPAAPGTSNAGGQQQPVRAANESPKDSPQRDNEASHGQGVAPIGTRPTPVAQNGNGVPLPKRTSPPLTSPIYGYAPANEQSAQHNETKGTTSAGGGASHGVVPATPASGASGSTTTEDKTSGTNARGPWANQGAWGGKGGLGSQAKVWG